MAQPGLGDVTGPHRPPRLRRRTAGSHARARAPLRRDVYRTSRMCKAAAIKRGPSSSGPAPCRNDSPRHASRPCRAARVRRAGPAATAAASSRHVGP